MGRPIKKNLIGNTATSGQQIQVSAWVYGDSQARNGYLVRQQGTGHYIAHVDYSGDSFQDTVALQNSSPTAAGQATVTVTPYGASGSGVSANATVGLYSTVIVTDGTGSTSASYAPGEVLTVVGGTNTAVATVTVHTVHARAAAVNDNANGYTVGDTFTFTSGDYLIPTVLRVATTTGNGQVATVTVTTGGSYTNPTLPTNPVTPTSAVTANTGVTGATFNIGWGLNTTSPAAQGVFTAIPSNPISLVGSALGTGATVNGRWTVNGVVMGVNGTGYDGAPLVSFVGGSPTGYAQAFSTVSSGGVSSVTVYAGGNYASIPSVTFTKTASTEYAYKINDDTVVTWGGNVYTWYGTGTTLTAAYTATITTA
jgi:hypothetical protein